MASTAGQISRDLICFDFRRLVAACAPVGAERGIVTALLAGEDRTARAVASAGLAALFTLPFLLLSSVILAAPLAVPAAIGLGYLAVSHALAARHRRRAAFINAFVLCGLVGWLAFFLLIGEGALSHTGLVAAFMAPLVAAAPAFARSLMGEKGAWPAAEAPPARDTALDRVAGLDALTPSEQVLVLDVDGTVLAATAAARGHLGLLPDAFEHNLKSLFGANELPPLFQAIDRCTERAETVAVDLSAGLEGRRSATFSVCGDGTVAMRLRERLPVEPHSVAASETTTPRAVVAQTAGSTTAAGCDIGEAAAFALRCAGPKAEAKQVRLTSATEADVAVACDRQSGRRIFRYLIESAVSGSQPGDAVHLIARRLKGVALLRVASEPGAGVGDCETDSNDRLDVATLRTLVEGAGGTLVVDRDGHNIALSVRLDLAGNARAGGEKCQS